eukprot:1319866-Rhodomonas_salina.3
MCLTPHVTRSGPNGLNSAQIIRSCPACCTSTTVLDSHENTKSPLLSFRCTTIVCSSSPPTATRVRPSGENDNATTLWGNISGLRSNGEFPLRQTSCCIVCVLQRKTIGLSPICPDATRPPLCNGNSAMLSTRSVWPRNSRCCLLSASSTTQTAPALYRSSPLVRDKMFRCPCSPV